MATDPTNVAQRGSQRPLRAYAAPSPGVGDGQARTGHRAFHTEEKSPWLMSG